MPVVFFSAVTFTETAKPAGSTSVPKRWQGTLYRRYRSGIRVRTVEIDKRPHIGRSVPNKTAFVAHHMVELTSLLQCIPWRNNNFLKDSF